jgi:hypothetical protein
VRAVLCEPATREAITGLLETVLIGAAAGGTDPHLLTRALALLEVRCYKQLLSLMCTVRL